MSSVVVLLYVFLAVLFQVGAATLAFRYLGWPLWIPMLGLGVILFWPEGKVPIIMDYTLWLFAAVGIALVFFFS